MTTSPEPSPLDVLVVDDDPAVARLVRVVLEREGLQVEHAHDAAAAREMLANRTCKVVLTDYTMPDVHGLDLVRSLEASGVRAAFLVMSAFLEQPVVHEICAEAAVAGMIRKPFELKELVRDVRAAMGAGDDAEPPAGADSGAETGPRSAPGTAADPRLRGC